MTKEEKMAIQKKEMTSFMNYFRDNQLDFNDTELLQKMQASITRIFQLEIVINLIEMIVKIHLD